MITYLYLLSYGRSGSTLLDWQLDCHPQILGLGEIGRMPDAFLPGAAIPEYCACGTPLSECDFWAPVMQEGRTITTKNDLDFEKWNNRLLDIILENRPDTKVIVDSSGHLSRLKQLLDSSLARKFQFKVLFYSRDARGVIYSATNRGYNKGTFKPTLLRAALGWWVRHLQFLSFIEKQPQEKLLHVSYEQFCRSPEDVLKYIHDRLDIKPLGFDLAWRQKVHHTFAGNERLRKNGNSRIKQDFEWLQGLGWLQNCIVELITGRVNRKLLRRTLET